MATKQEALATLDQAYAGFAATIREIDEPHGTWQGALGSWSVVNVLQHVDGWLVEMTEAMQRVARDEPLWPPDLDYSNIDAWNAKFVETRGAQSMAEARSAFAADHDRFRAAVDALPADRFEQDEELGEVVRGTGATHYDEHREQIERYLGGAHD